MLLEAWLRWRRPSSGSVDCTPIGSGTPTVLTLIATSASVTLGSAAASTCTKAVPLNWDAGESTRRVKLTKFMNASPGLSGGAGGAGGGGGGRGGHGGGGDFNTGGSDTVTGGNPTEMGGGGEMVTGGTPTEMGGGGERATGGSTLGSDIPEALASLWTLDHEFRSIFGGTNLSVKSSQVKSSSPPTPFHHCWPPEHIR